MTQAELADAIKVHPNTVSDIERGNNFPSLKVGLDIARALNISIRWLIGESDNHRKRIQVESDEEYRNWMAYQAMSPEEKRELIQFMTDLHKARGIAKGETQS